MSPVRHYRIAVLLLSAALLGMCAGPENPSAAAASCGGLGGVLARLLSMLLAGLAGALLVGVMWTRTALRRRRYDRLAAVGGWGLPRRPRSAWGRWPS
ncbi:MAG: hypothetical protein ACRDZO_05210 [Egibacteraceae bacterium]